MDWPAAGPRWMAYAKQGHGKETILGVINGFIWDCPVFEKGF